MSTGDTPEGKVAHGHTAAGFESVAQVLEQSAEAHGEAGCGISAYIDGQKVVDLWWGTADGRLWQEDTLVAVASCTKGLVALCAQILFDRGLLDVDAPVTRYWPEYGANGKQSTLVRHLLNHTAGVLTFPDYWKVIGPDRAELADWDLMTRNLAAAPPSWEPGTRCQYHPFSFGYLVGEVIRRVDGRSVGRFLAEEVASPLHLDLFIGAPEWVLPRVATQLPARLPDADILRAWASARALVRAGDVLSMGALPWSMDFRHPDLEVTDLRLEFQNSRRYRMAEVPAANGITTARDLARMYALLAGGGELGGVRLVSPESIERFRPTKTGGTFGLGYHSLAEGVPVRGASPGAFGHAGGGGRLGFADPDKRLSFGFVNNQPHRKPLTALDLASAVYDCL